MSGPTCFHSYREITFKKKQAKVWACGSFSFGLQNLLISEMSNHRCAPSSTAGIIANNLSSTRTLAPLRSLRTGNKFLLFSAKLPLDFERKSALDRQFEQCLVPSPIQICVPSRHPAAATVTATAAAKNL